jgi:hypothetical protein
MTGPSVRASTADGDRRAGTRLEHDTRTRVPTNDRLMAAASPQNARAARAIVLHWRAASNPHSSHFRWSIQVQSLVSGVSGIVSFYSSRHWTAVGERHFGASKLSKSQWSSPARETPFAGRIGVTGRRRDLGEGPMEGSRGAARPSTQRQCLSQDDEELSTPVEALRLRAPHDRLQFTSKIINWLRCVPYAGREVACASARIPVVYLHLLRNVVDLPAERSSLESRTPYSNTTDHKEDDVSAEAFANIVSCVIFIAIILS